MKMHMVLDHLTGNAKARGKSGRWYSHQDIERAYAARKNPGADPDGLAIAADLDRTDLTEAELQQAMLDEMHDCPDCRAERAAGIAPQLVRVKKPRKLRWREQKRRAR